MKNAHKKIAPEIKEDGKIRIRVTLSADGNLFENNTDMDVRKDKNVEYLERAFERQAQRQVLRTIHKLQKEYGIDIFGFGEVIHRKQPLQWRTLKKDWDHHFRNAEISVKVHLKIKQVGLSGPSLLYKESGNAQ